ncbi:MULTISPECIES: YtxH domain-containing protein [Saccharibacillus]|uniref:YtxH domain-containing protein n=1 Tax=Saccharibacillus brassicae TaxID=2583377 RepID=A0A4Y6V0K2_SACBS|nr:MULTISPECIES: YtxH domain-containing protein [Saccharibacillus]MWJ33063.1 YtxH domain-containing protein [Saccharibacillus sp. WB 17]QDH23559.1 YtxH domain-containing protein [Saccharibacillus brassicae]
MATTNSENNAIIVGAVAGALIGAGLAVLVAAQEGASLKDKFMNTVNLLKEQGAVLNERSQELKEKGQEVKGILQESVDVVREFKDEATSAASDIKSEVKSFKS